MAKNPAQHKRTKYIEIILHFLRDNVEKWLVKMVFYKTEDQIADTYTKALSKDKFKENCMKLGVMKLN